MSSVLPHHFRDNSKGKNDEANLKNVHHLSVPHTGPRTQKDQKIMLRSNVLACWLLVAMLAPQVWAWHGKGHELVTLVALRSLKERIPPWMIDSSLVVHCSQDPDLFSSLRTDQLRATEFPEHFIDWELLADNELPATRYEFLGLCAKLKQRPAKVGTLPYALSEWAERLTIAFAEHRRYPDNPDIKAKCAIYAGILAHYAADLCQPLHLTVHYNGRVGPSGESPKTGIHAKVDALLGKLVVDPAAAARSIRPTVADRVLPFIVAEIQRSRQLVDRVYELEGQLPEVAAPLEESSDVAHFAAERLRVTSTFLSSLLLTAWERSGSVDLPRWYTRAESESTTTQPAPQ